MATVFAKLRDIAKISAFNFQAALRVFGFSLVMFFQALTSNMLNFETTALYQRAAIISYVMMSVITKKLYPIQC